MGIYSKFLEIQSGRAAQVDLSQNTLALLAMQLNGSTSGTLTQNANATTTSYSVFWPAAQAAANTYLKNDGAGNMSWATAGTGTVTSVAFADASTSPIYSISGSPVTSSGTLTITLATQSANTVFAGATSGGSAQPTFRALVAADIPSLSSVYLALSGGTMSGNINMNSNSITNLANPVNPGDAVNYTTLQAMVNGVSWKTAVLVATTANITLSGEQTIDGFTTSSSRVLVKNQTTTANNGIYVSGSGAWTRSTDMNTWAEVPGSAVFVQEGTVNADLGFVCTSAPGGTLGTTAITFVQFSAAGAYTADGVTLQLVSGVFSIKNQGVNTTQIANNAVTITQLATSGITDGVTLDQSGAGNTFEIKTGGVGTTQLAATAVTSAKVATGVFDQSTITGGAGTAASVQFSPSTKRTLVAGQAFSANTSYAVRWGLTANGETSGRVYAADTTTSSFDLFYVIGMAQSGTAVSIGGNITVTGQGSFTLGSNDTAFGANTDGAPVFLTAAGTFSTTAPSTAGSALTRIGMVQVRSATNTSCIIDVAPETIAVN